MIRSPSILIWHADGQAYGEALRQRLPGVDIDVVRPADHDTGSAAAEAAVAGRAEVLLAWKVPADALTPMNALRWIQVTGAGVDHFLGRDDLSDEIIVSRSLGRFGVQVAEYTIGYLLHHLLGIEGYRERQQRAAWERQPRPLLADRTVGVVGLGSLGHPIARALGALGTTVLGVRRSTAADDAAAEVFTLDTWAEMLPRCDALVLAAPKTTETCGLVDAEVLAALPRGAVVINVARGDLIDDNALFEALEAGHLGAAVLDVFTHEPLPADHPLWAHPRAWITPHIAAPSEVEVIADEFAENYRRFVDGRDMRHVVDRARGY